MSQVLVAVFFLFYNYMSGISVINVFSCSDSAHCRSAKVNIEIMFTLYIVIELAKSAAISLL